jgi:hypothetical protein
MKRFLSVALAVLMAAAVAPAASAGKKPVKTTMYMHGNYPVGEGFELVGNLADSTTMTLDAVEPAVGAPKSMAWFQPGNDQCTGNPLFPSWSGRMAGTINGDLKMIVNTVGAPSTVTARVWVDVPFSSCTSAAAGVDAFVPANAEQVVDIPAGANEVAIIFKKLKLKVTNNIIVELHQTSPTNQGRVLYDSPEFASRLEFNCVPASGKTCTL